MKKQQTFLVIYGRERKPLAKSSVEDCLVIIGLLAGHRDIRLPFNSSKREIHLTSASRVESGKGDSPLKVPFWIKVKENWD